MLTRRQMMRWTGAALAVGAGIRDAAAAIDFDVPRGACDCHVHVVADPVRFPMAPDRVYTPPQAPTVALLDLQRRLHLDRVVIVQPSFYGTDNAAILDAMRQLGPSRARGVAVVGDAMSSSVLDALRDAGIRGIRVNLETAGQTDPALAAAKLRAAIAQSRPRGWHIQLYTRPAVISALAGELANSPVPIVFDHFAGAQAAAGPGQPGFDAVLALVRSGAAYVKISAPYRASKAPAPYDDVAPLARTLVAANPDRVLWGSDWPHPDSTHARGRSATDITPFLPIDDALVFDQLPRWISDAAIRRKILVDAPGRLYGF